MLFVSTPLDLGSAELLEPLVDAYKVASGDNDFVPLLDRLADSDRPLIVSTGLLDLDGIRARSRRGSRAAARSAAPARASPSSTPSPRIRARPSR